MRNIPGGVLIAFVIGVIDSIIVWGVASLFDVSIFIPESSGSETLTDLTIAPLLLIIAVSSILAGILLWVLQRFAPDRALIVFQVVAVIALALSLILPFTLDQPIEGRLALVAMHLLVGSAIIATLTWVAMKPPLRPQDPVED